MGVDQNICAENRGFDEVLFDLADQLTDADTG